MASLEQGECMGDGKPVTYCECESPLNGGFCLFCNSRAGNSSAYDPNPNSYNDSPNFSDYTPQPQYDTYFCELCGNDAHYGYDCPPQVPFVYPVQDSDSLMEEIDLFLTPDDSMPPGIKNDDYDSEGDILFLDELLSNDSPSLPENESFHFNIPSSPRPLAKPPDDRIYFDPIREF
ncbi:hypothetical protein Tco_0850599 [Tanacetum coccineum]